MHSCKILNFKIIDKEIILKFYTSIKTLKIKTNCFKCWSEFRHHSIIMYSIATDLLKITFNSVTNLYLVLTDIEILCIPSLAFIALFLGYTLF